MKTFLPTDKDCKGQIHPSMGNARLNKLPLSQKPLRAYSLLRLPRIRKASVFFIYFMTQTNERFLS